MPNDQSKPDDDLFKDLSKKPSTLTAVKEELDETSTNKGDGQVAGKDGDDQIEEMIDERRSSLASFYEQMQEEPGQIVTRGAARTVQAPTAEEKPED